MSGMPKVHFADTNDRDMFYFVHEHIADPFFFVETERGRFVLLNVLEINAFKEKQKGDIEAVPIEPLISEARALSKDGTTSEKFAFLVFKKYALLGRPVQVSKHFPLDIADYLRAQGAQLTVTDLFLSERLKKTTREIEYIKESVRITCKAFERIENILRASVIKGPHLIFREKILTSEYLKEEVELLLFKQGMENPDGLIISSGVQASMPHHTGSGPIFANQSIVCDIFPRNRENGYFADVSRSFVKGPPSEKVAKMYDAVRDAQDAAYAVVGSGIAAKAVHEAAAKIIRERGFDVGEKGFIHGLGHGVGLDVHEAPHLSATSQDTLEPGMVITIEPGLYYPEHGGVRLEDMIVITDKGYQNLTKYPRTFVIP